MLSSAFPSCSPLSAAQSLSALSFLGRSWITKIDYAVTSQIPLPRAWPHSVWLEVGQACLRDAPLALLEKGQSAGRPRRGHTASHRGKWTRNHSCLQEGMKMSSLKCQSPAINLPLTVLQLLVTTFRCVIRLYHRTMLMTSPPSGGHSSKTSIQILGEVLSIITRR